nr:unnamed protein product [Callosobruchus analis]
MFFEFKEKKTISSQCSKMAYFNGTWLIQLTYLVP